METGAFSYRVIGSYNQHWFDMSVEDPNEYIQIPCGKCIGCRLEYASKWADRLIAEAQYHDKACFITLTYSDEYLPARRMYKEGDTLFPSPFHPLVKKHMQLFMKRLRKKFGKDIRFYGVGEYGEKNMRPHYHIILFGVDFSDDRELMFIKDGFPHYVSNTLYDHLPADRSKSLWKYGLCDIAEVSWQSCAYVARYTVKKLKGLDSGFYKKYNYEPEFALMSRRPGIGTEFIKDHLDSYKTGLFVPTEKGALELSTNKFFDKKFANEYPAEFVDWQEERKEFNISRQRQKLQRTDLRFNDLQDVVERSKIKQSKRLRRELEE